MQGKKEQEETPRRLVSRLKLILITYVYFIFNTVKFTHHFCNRKKCESCIAKILNLCVLICFQSYSNMFWLLLKYLFSVSEYFEIYFHNIKEIWIYYIFYFLNILLNGFQFMYHSDYFKFKILIQITEKKCDVI